MKMFNKSILPTPLAATLGTLLVILTISGCTTFNGDNSDRQVLTRADFATQGGETVTGNSKSAENSAGNASKNLADSQKNDKTGSTNQAGTDQNATAASPIHQESTTATTTDIKPKTRLPETNNNANNNSVASVDPNLAREIDNLPKPTIVSNVKEVKQEGRTVTVNAMIGQVNGRPVFASDVLEPLDAQLAALGSTQPRKTFYQMSQKLIADRLYQIVFDSLFLGEAQRKFSEQEIFRVNIIMKLNREELIRKWGAGSEAKAQKTIVERTGKTIEETLQSVRHRLLIRKYQDETLFPRISVSRRDIERYYQDHFDEFNPKPGRTLRLMRVLKKSDADKLDARLAKKETFAKVARSSLNKYQASKGGLMSESAVGDKVFGFDELNKAMLKLKEGEHSGRLTIKNGGGESYWWLFIEKIEQGEAKTLRDVQLKIEQQLKSGQYLLLEKRYRRKLFENGSYNPLEEMGRALVEIAISKYAA